MSTVVVTDPRQWLGMKEAWRFLHANTVGATVEQSFDYLREWWKFCGIWRDLHIVVVRREESIVGIAPLMIEHVASPAGFFRRMRFLGAPAAVGRPLFLFGKEAGVCHPALAVHLANCPDDWDVLEIDALPDDAATKGLVHGLRAAGGAASGVPCVKAFLARSQAGTGNWPTVADAAGIESGFEAYCDFEDACMQHEESDSLTDRKEDYFFYRELARRFTDEERLLVTFLREGDALVAASLGILGNGTYVRLRHAIASGGRAEERRASLQRRELQMSEQLPVEQLQPAFPGVHVSGWNYADSRRIRLLASRRSLRLRAVVAAKRMAWLFAPRGLA